MSGQTQSLSRKPPVSYPFKWLKSSFNPEHVIQDHRKCARRLWSIREQYINLLADLADGAVGEDDARHKRDALVNELQEVYRDAPDTSPKAYAAAQIALKVKDEMTFADNEIDKFLPRPLRRTD